MTSSKEYIKMILFLIVINSVIWTTMSELLFVRFSIGFSGILFGIITIYPQNSFFGFNIKKYLFPFAMLTFMQLIIPNVSFIGHLIGIISGHLYLYYD
jgi:membrane associated rhomboid family serine protease